MLTECSWVCISHIVHFSRPCTEKTFEIQTALLAAAGRSGNEGVHACMCTATGCCPAQKQGCAHTSHLTLPHFLYGAPDETLCSYSALTRQRVPPSFSGEWKSKRGAHQHFALWAGAAPAVLQASLALPSSQPTAHVGEQLWPGWGPSPRGWWALEVISSSDTAVAMVCYFQSHSIFNLDCQTHL